jgi:hypothetical protein
MFLFFSMESHQKSWGEGREELSHFKRMYGKHSFLSMPRKGYICEYLVRKN